MSKILILISIFLLLSFITFLIPSSNSFLGEWKKALLLFIFKKVKYLIGPFLLVAGILIWSLVNSYNYNQKEKEEELSAFRADLDARDQTKLVFDEKLEDKCFVIESEFTYRIPKFFSYSDSPISIKEICFSGSDYNDFLTITLNDNIVDDDDVSTKKIVYELNDYIEDRKVGEFIRDSYGSYGDKFFLDMTELLKGNKTITITQRLGESKTITLN